MHEQKVTKQENEPLQHEVKQQGSVAISGDTPKIPTYQMILKAHLERKMAPEMRYKYVQVCTIAQTGASTNVSPPTQQ